MPRTNSATIAKPSTPEAPVSENELAELLRTDKATLRRWIKQQRVPEPDIRISRRKYFWTTATINRFLAGGWKPKEGRRRA